MISSLYSTPRFGAYWAPGKTQPALPGGLPYLLTLLAAHNDQPTLRPVGYMNERSTHWVDGYISGVLGNLVNPLSSEQKASFVQQAFDAAGPGNSIRYRALHAAEKHPNKQYRQKLLRHFTQQAAGDRALLHHIGKALDQQA